MAKAEFFIPRPPEADGTGTFMVYRTEVGEDLKWSASFPLPQIGDRIQITMNGIGEAEVMGYFKEGGVLGVMAKALLPPKWLKDQRDKERNSSSFDSLPTWRKEGIGCQFGAEIALLYEPN
jgi:hypothetical protein